MNHGYWEVRWVCTDANKETGCSTHPSRELQVLAVYERAGVSEVSIIEHRTGRGDAVDFGLPEDSGGTWRLPCPTCGRDPKLGPATMLDRMLGLRAARVSLVDISRVLL